MSKSIDGISQRGAALIAAGAYSVLFVVAIINEILVGQQFVVSENAAKVVQNIRANEMLFRIDILHFLILFICDFMVTWALYIFFRNVNKAFSLLAACFRFTYTVISSVVLLTRVIALKILDDTQYSTLVGEDQLNANIILLLNTYKSGWHIAFIFFGFHIFILGYLTFTSKYIPKFLGILFMIASFGFVIYSFTCLLLPSPMNYKSIFKGVIGLIAFAGELSFAVWLFLRGGLRSHNVL